MLFYLLSFSIVKSVARMHRCALTQPVACISDKYGQPKIGETRRARLLLSSSIACMAVNRTTRGDMLPATNVEVAYPSAPFARRMLKERQAEVHTNFQMKVHPKCQ